MQQEQRELLISRIISGKIRLHIDGQIFLFIYPSKNIIYQANEVYQNALEKAIDDGLYTEGEILQKLIKRNLWSETEEGDLEKRKKEIEDFKVELYKSVFSSDKKKWLEKALVAARKDLERLLNKRNICSFQTQTGYASICKLHFLLQNSIFYPGRKQKRVFYKNSIDKSLFDKVFEYYISIKLTESQYRELARKEPWYHLWIASKKGDSLFGRPVTSYTEEQVNLVNWSMQYDNIREHPECPSESIINNDDALDGWIIIQSRKQHKAEIEKDAEGFLKNEKIKNADEIFIMAGTKEDADRIEQLNTDQAKAIKQRKLKKMAAGIEINEAEMPDTKRELQTEYNRLYIEKMKGQPK